MELTLIILLVLVVLGAGGYWVVRSRAPREDVLCHYRCPNCDKKLRYRASRAGKPAVCPACRVSSTLPPAPEGPGGAGGKH